MDKPATKVPGHPGKFAKSAAELPSEDELLPWTPRRRRVRLTKRENGWYIIAPSGNLIPATDWETSLWLDLIEALEEIRRLKGA
jgi:hypothetical protein